MTSPLEGFMSNIRATRVSFVKHPANKRQFLITKSKDNNSMDEIVQIITESEAGNEQELVTALKSQGKDESTVNAALSVYRTMNAFRDSLGEEDLASIAKSLGYEAATAGSDASDDDKAGADVSARKSEDDKAADTGNDTGSDAVLSAVNEVLDELRTEVRALKGDKRRAEFAKMVDGIAVGKSEDELISMLEQIDDAGGDVEEVVETLKSATNIAKNSLFNEVGSNGAGQAGSDAYNKMQSAVREIAKSESVSETRAWELVKDRRPELVEEYYNTQ